MRWSERRVARSLAARTVDRMPTPTYELHLTTPGLWFRNLEGQVVLERLADGTVVALEPVTSTHVRWYYVDWTDEQWKLARDLCGCYCGDSCEDYTPNQAYWSTGTFAELDAIVRL